MPGRQGGTTAAIREAIGRHPHLVRGAQRVARWWVRLFPLRVLWRRPRPLYPEEADRFTYQQQFNRMTIRPGGVVLDVGSGAYPFPAATILGDRFLETTRHRSEQLARDGRPFVVFDVQNLPFADGSVDFIYCSHVLEHVDDPRRACAELMRVGKSGYIETPNFAKDVLFAWASDMHRWHVVAINNYVVFFEYTPRQSGGIGSPAWRNLVFSPEHSDLQAAFWRHQDLFNTMFGWQGGFNCIVFRQGREPEYLVPVREAPACPRP